MHFLLPFSPKAFPASFLRRVPTLVRSPYDTLDKVLGVASQAGLFLSDGRLVFKMPFTDELL